MGLFDLFGKKKTDGAPQKKQPSEREFVRLSRMVGDKMAQNYDRQEALEAMSAVGTAQSAAALLRRFNWSMDPSITDQEEKELALRGVVAAGDAALDPLRTYCAKAESLTWPLKVLREIVPEERIADELLALLDQFDTDYVRNADPKTQLITALEAHPSDEVRVAVEPFLVDASEPVRFAAVGTLFAMKDVKSVPALVAQLAEDESLRVKNRIAQGLVDAGWEVPPDARPACRAALPPDFRLDGAAVRRAR